MRYYRVWYRGDDNEAWTSYGVYAGYNNAARIAGQLQDLGYGTYIQ